MRSSLKLIIVILLFMVGPVLIDILINIPDIPSLGFDSSYMIFYIGAAIVSMLILLLYHFFRIKSQSQISVRFSIKRVVFGVVAVISIIGLISYLGALLIIGHF